MTKNNLADKTVVVYDDQIARIFADEIRLYLQCKCMAYNSAMSCLKDLEEGLEFDLLFSDLSIEDLGKFHRGPRLSGEDIVKLVKEKYPQVPIVTISANAVRPAGSNYHFIKPLMNTEGYLEVISAYLEKRFVTRDATKY